VKPQPPHSRTSNLLCTVTTLCTASLTPLSFLTVSVSIPIHFLSLFCLGWTVCLLSCSPLSTADRLSRSKISVLNPSYPSPKVPRMEVDNETYDRQSRTARNLGQQLLHQQCSATTVNRNFLHLLWTKLQFHHPVTMLTKLSLLMLSYSICISCKDNTVSSECPGKCPTAVASECSIAIYITSVMSLSAKQHSGFKQFL
jgi:hypothetical protein